MQMTVEKNSNVCFKKRRLTEKPTERRKSDNSETKKELWQLFEIIFDSIQVAIVLNQCVDKLS